MEYKQFIVRVFEHKPEKWRASVERVDGRVLMAMTNRRKLFKFITGADAGIRIAPGDSRLLPAEHAAASMIERQSSNRQNCPP
jgi:hypothetical protein